MVKFSVQVVRAFGERDQNFDSHLLNEQRRPLNK